MLPRDPARPGSALSPLDGPARTYVRGELSSEGDITLPNNPLPPPTPHDGQIELSEAPPWHVHLELLPDQLVALHRLGFTSGGLAWREGMEGWQPLASRGDDGSATSRGGEVPDEAGEMMDLEDTQEGNAVQDDSSLSEGDEHSALEGWPARAGRKGFVFARGRRVGASPAPGAAPAFGAVPVQPLRPPPAIPLPSHPLDQESAAAFEDVLAPRTVPLPSPFSPQYGVDPPYTPAVPAPVPQPAWLTPGAAADKRSSFEKLASIAPLSIDSAAGAGMRARTLWTGAGISAVLSACVAALVSAIIWRARVESNVTMIATSAQAPRAVLASPASRSPGTAEPEPTSVSVEELPLLTKGAVVPAATMRSRTVSNAQEPSSSSPEERMADRLRKRTADSRESAEPGPPDRNAIARAMTISAGAARSCGAGPENGTVMVTFSPSGNAQSIQLLKPFSGRDVNACVLRAMSRARVPAFVGEPVAVRKSLRW